MERLSRERIVRALEALADELPPDAGPITLAVIGGGALVLLYRARETTKDLDAFAIDTEKAATVREAARRAATRETLPEDWLNDGAKGYVHGLQLGDVVFQRRSLTVHALADAQLLAMKLSAWRDDVDIDDARFLLERISGPREDVWRQVLPHVVPGRELKARYAFDDLWEATHGPA